MDYFVVFKCASSSLSVYSANQFVDFFGNAKEQTGIEDKKKRSKSNPILLLPAKNKKTNYRCHICTALGHQKVCSDGRPSCKQIPPNSLS